MDDKSKKSLNAASWYIISNFISKAMLYICTPLFTRLLSTAEYGQYTNFLSWQTILVTMLTFDLGASVVIAYYDYDNDEYNGLVNTISIFSYIIPGLFCVVIFCFSDFFSTVFAIPPKYLFILLLYITCNNTLGIFQSDQRVRLKYKTSSLLTIVSSLCTVLLTIFFALVFEDKLEGVLLGGIIVNSVVGLGLTYYLWNRSKILRMRYLKYALLVAVPLVPHVLAGNILGASDKIMITKYCGEEATALYGLVYTITLVITMITSSINKAWVPWFFDRLKNNKIKQIKAVSNSLSIIICIISVLFCFIAPEIVLIVGGRNYKDGVMIIPPLIASCFIECISTYYINIEFYNKKTVGISVATMISASVNLVLNYVLLSRYGYTIAAYTTLLSSLITLLFHFYKVYRQHMWHVFNNRLLIVLVVSTIVICEAIRLIYPYSLLRVFMVLIMLAFAAVYCLHKRETIMLMINAFRKGQ